MAVYDKMAVQPGDVRYGNIPFAVAGQIMDLYFHEIVSREVKDATLDFGAPVIQNADGTISVATDGTAGVLFGIAVRELTREMDVRGYDGVTKYILGNVAAVMLKGHLYVQLAADSAADTAVEGAVYFSNGMFYGSALGSGAETLVAIPGAKYQSVGTAGDIVEVYLG